VNRRSVEALTQVSSTRSRGADGTDVRPGIIGEIGSDKPWLSAQEERVFRAVAAPHGRPAWA